MKPERIFTWQRVRAQMSGGYSIQVEELGESSNGIFFVTKLLWTGGS